MECGNILNLCKINVIDHTKERSFAFVSHLFIRLLLFFSFALSLIHVAMFENHEQMENIATNMKFMGYNGI